MIETHAHLYFDKFDADRDEVIQSAYAAGVQKIINIGIDIETSQQCIELAENHQGLFAVVGIHPNDAGKLTDSSLMQLQELASHPKVVAIGEIGMDFYWDASPRDIQESAFRIQINLAKELNLPIVIHNREAARAIIDVLKSEGTENLSGVFHCFSEETAIAEEVLKLGFYISFTGNVTFKNSALPQVAEVVPLDRLLLETDCPFLSPVPKRGRRNEPAYLVYIAEKLAEIKAVSISEITKRTTGNAERLFGLHVEETV